MFTCRICLATENLTNIFKNFNSTQITTATGVTIKENDGLPQLICQPCKNLVKNALKLRQQSLHTEKMLLNQLNARIKQENLSRAESTDSDNEPSKLFRQQNKKMPQTKHFAGEGSKTTKSNKCETENAKDVSKNEHGEKQSAQLINVKIEYHSESEDNVSGADNADEDFLEKITLEPSRQGTAYTKEELKEVYRILDQESEKYKKKYKWSNNLKKLLAKDEIYHSLSRDLKYLYYKLMVDTHGRKTERVKCESENAKVVSKNESRPEINENTTCSVKSEEQSLKVNVKIENCSESSDQDNTVSAVNKCQENSNEISQKLDTRGIPTTNIELEQIYKILDQDLEQSKATYKSDVHLKKVLKGDNVFDVNSILPKNAVGNTEKMAVTSKMPMKCKNQMKTKTSRKQSHDPAKIAKLWSLAVKPVNRKKPVQCSVCHKSFKYNYFPAHAAIHLDKEFTCEVCGKKFVHVYALDYHQQRMHGATRKHKCSQCDYTAVLKEELLNHVNRAHTGLRPFICDVCGDTFSWKRVLVQHMRKHFGVKRFKCEFCCRLYTSTSQLSQHRTQYHLYRFHFMCYQCEYSSTVRETIRRHLQKTHGIPKNEQQRLKIIKEKR